MSREELIETMARAIYESHGFKKPWGHLDTVRVWHPIGLRNARVAVAAIEAAGWRIVPPDDGR